jgi:hypothetical protein
MMEKHKNGIKKVALVFECIQCDYFTSKKCDYTKHLLTRKHKNINNFAEKYQCIPCSYFTSVKCNYTMHLLTRKHKSINKIDCLDNDSENDNLIKVLMKENTEFKQLIIEQNKQMIELAKNAGTNNINSNNKTKFNLNFFLNDTCKDALNLTDFVSSIKLQLTDLENVGKNGYVSGISNIIVKNLNALEVNKRPVHCSDYKRDIMYIKDENKWEKENDEKEKLSKAIKKVSYKNVLQIQNWQKENPGCEYSNNKKNDEYLQIVNESMGAFTEEENIENINKIIKNVAKEVIIEKEI